MSPDHRDLVGTDSVKAPPTRLGRLLRPVGRAVFNARWDVHVHGAEYVPPAGPVLLASNHVGVLDGPLLVAVAPRMVHALVKREMFDGGTGPLLHAVGQIKLERHDIDPAAVKSAVRVLRDGGVVGIYPEGTRGAGEVDHAHLGFAYLAMVTGAQVVPVANLGTRDPGGSTSSTPGRGSRLDIVFGPGVDVAKTPWPRRRGVVEPLAEQLRQRLARHVEYAVELTGQVLPGPVPDGRPDESAPGEPMVGPAA
ncbi:MAG: lysophospholipid acyltransferase family protein [Nocardioidaceae bacterium]